MLNTLETLENQGYASTPIKLGNSLTDSPTLGGDRLGHRETRVKSQLVSQDPRAESNTLQKCIGYTLFSMVKRL